MYKKLYAILMSLFLTCTVLPQNIYAEEVTEETEEEITETEEETVPEEINAEEEPVEEPEEEPVEEVIPAEEPEAEPEPEVIEEEPEDIISETEESGIEETEPAETEEITEEVPEQEEIPEESPEVTPSEPEEDVIEETAEETTEADAADDVSGDFEYTVSNSAVTITKYTGSSAEVVIPSEINGSAVTAIGQRAFLDCTGLTEIVIPDSVTTIDAYAFVRCSNLRQVTLSENLEELNGAAFAECTSLTSITVPASVKEVNGADYDYGWRGPFYGCTGLTEVTLAEGMEEVANSLLQDCESLTTINWPEGLTTIGEGTFGDCTGLTEIVIPDSVTKIDAYAFVRCSNLRQVTLSENLEELNGAAFAECTSLTGITIPASVKEVNGADYDYGWRGPFYGCTGLTEVTLADGMEEVADNLLKDCTGLTTINWPEGLTSIGEGTFGDCTGLTNVELPESLTYIGRYAFADCTGLTEIVIPDSVTTIDAYAFKKCSNLRQVTLSENLEELNGAAFADCISLTSITIPASLKEVNGADYDYDWRGPFYGCTGLTEVTLAEGMEEVANSLLQDCTALEIVTIPAAVTSIGDYAFNNCTALNSVIYPGSEDEWNRITIGEANESLGNAVFYFNGDKPQIMEKPVPPALTAETAGHKSVYLSWTYEGDSSLVSSYILYRSFDGIEYSSVEAFDPNSENYTDQVYFAGTSQTCYYKLKVYDRYGRSNISDVVTAEAVSTDTERPVAVMSPARLNYAVAGSTYYFSGGLSSDNDSIASYHWDFSDGASYDEENISHIFENEGTFTVTLTVTDVNGLSSSASQTVNVIEIGENSAYTRLSLTVCNAVNREPVENAQIIIERNDFRDVLTAPEGTLEYIVPNGEYMIGAFADGFISRTVKISAAGGNQEHLIGLSTGSILSGSITTTELTYDEIVDAGIDVNAPGNEHVYKFETTLTFIAGLKEYELPIEVLKNENNEVVGRSGFTFSGEGWTGEGEFIELPTLQIYPITEKFILIIYGEAHWLKEMYKVELFVNNDSQTDTIEQLSAELQLPQGLSLADMTDGVQSLYQQLGTLGYNENTRAIWYIRGDEEGEYYLSAKVHGVSMPYGDFIEEEFTTSEPVKVYAGSALHMTITCPDVAERGKDYNVKFRLENVSDKSLYNLSFGITGSEQYKVLGYGDAEAWIPIENCEYGDDWSHTVAELAPGGYIELSLSTTIWFNSVLELMKLIPKVGAFLDVAYYLTDISVVTLEGSTTEIPYDIVVERAERDYLVDKIIDELVGKFLKDNGIDIGGSLGDTVIELIGAGLGIDTTMISTAKTILKLQKGETNHTLEISVDDGRGAADSIYNDYLSITTGSGGEAIVDTLNGTKLKVEAGEVSFTAQGPGNTKVKIGVYNSYGKKEQEYVLDVHVIDHKFGEKVTVTEDSVTGKYYLDENEFTAKITEERENELDIYKLNPYQRIRPKFTVEIDGQTSDSEYSVVMNNVNLKSLFDQTTVTEFEVKGNAGILTFPRELMTTLTDAEGEVEISAENTQQLAQNDEGTWESYYRFTVNTENGEVKNFNGSSALVTVPFALPSDITNPEVLIDHIKDDGTVETLEGIYNAETQTVSFTTTGFSTFRIYTDGISRTIETAVITGIEDKEWTGSEITQTPVVTFEGETLAEGTDYELVYENNTNVGTATVTVTGKGNYTGAVTNEFAITPKVITPEVTLSTLSYTYNGKARKPGVTVKDGETALVKGTDYTVTYGAGRTNAGTYNVKVTLQGNYSGSKKVSFTITPKAITPTVTLTTSEYTYNGKARTPGVTVKEGSTKLVKDTDYTVTYASGRTKVGTYNVTVKLKGNYTGRKTVQFRILPAATTKIAAANKAGGIKLAWKAVTGATGYKIYRNGTLAKTIKDASILSWGDTKATSNGTKYTYKIVAYAAAGDSKVYKEITIYRLSQPKITSLTNSAAGKLTVKWGKNTKATGYQIQYSTSSKFTASTTKTVTVKGNTTVSKVIGSLKKGKTYYVRVRSYKTASSVNHYSMWSAASKLKLTK